MFQFLVDCHLAPEGIEIRLIGCLTVYRLRYENIRGAWLVKGLFGCLRYGAHPFNTISLGNRLQWTSVLIEKRRWPRFLWVTPADPEAFLRDLKPIG